ncbi:hypothetical protein B4N89_05475 [Embleya scabrispora]|uniref:Uncharacterized protein n=1 Tax=Embleya scabrispora TaxID=159449 RepID=A0A1T3NV00_9ACTN|nr:hypothetical protein [Embleya scabrispora]OPC80472.1 hypothetical protein B4N89_05475 [Embleya scabrispora]
MDSTDPWTVDRIAHALPHPEARHEFLRLVNLTPIGDLPGLLARYVQAAEELIAGLPHARALAAQVRTTGLDPDLDEVDEEIVRKWISRGRAQSSAA